MIERALRFGETSPLVGVLTQPRPENKRSDVPGIVLLNSGIIHHIGANRLYVQIARRMAEMGFTSLRFDFSGVGDSEPRRDTLPFEESAIVETKEAMDYLGQVSGAEEFVLMGLCSGADMSYFTAVDDQRVVGLAQLDAFVYRTPGWYMRKYGPKILNLGAWINAVQCRVGPMINKIRGAEDEGASEVFVAPEYRRVFPPKDTVEAGMRGLAQRGVHLFFTFTGDEEHIAYREQYEESFSSIDFGGKIRVEYMPEADHTFTGIHEQQHVIGMLADWCSNAWLSDESGPGYGEREALATVGA